MLTPLVPKTSVASLFLSATDMVRLIQRKGLQQCLVGIANNIRDDFLRWNSFDKSARVANHSADGVIELMPISNDALYSFKYVNGHPKNTQAGLSTVMAFGVLADVQTGAPLLLSELTLTTAPRTAATSALAAKTLARPNSRIMAMIGNGAQSEFQALAFQQMLGIEEIRLFDLDPSATVKLIDNLQGTGLRLIPCTSTAQAVKGADIVTTVTADKTNATILTGDMIETGVHINGVGGDCPGKTELHVDVLTRRRVFVEYTPQTRIEGDIQQLPPDFGVTELWKVLAGHEPSRMHKDEVTIFDSVGFALEDYSALRFMHDAARDLHIGEMIELIPTLEDPKNLFGALLSSSTLMLRAA